MFKVTLLIIALFLFSCDHDIVVDDRRVVENRCSEPLELSTLFLSTINEINTKEKITMKDTLTIIRFSSPSLNFDSNNCSGYTSKVRNAAKQLLRRRKADFTPALYTICIKKIPETHDLSLMGAIAEEKRNSKEALKIIGESTEECDKNQNNNDHLRYGID